MTHQEAKQLLVAPVGLETEEQAIFRLERAKRLKAMARNTGRGQHIPIAELASMPPIVAIQRLGLPPRVILDELRALSEAQQVKFVPFPPLPLSGR